MEPLYIRAMNASETGPVASEMRRRLEQALKPTRLDLVDDSEAHRGHGGYNPAGESHFTLIIESPAFAGKSRVDRQRLVYAALGDLMRERVHALSIRATAPGE
jgi:BolA protein